MLFYKSRLPFLGNKRVKDGKEKVSSGKRVGK